MSTSALAGSAASGQLAFHPCSRCHPVSVDSKGEPTKKLPVGIKRHEIKLEVHDILGDGDTACRACHDDPNSADPGRLILPDGGLVDITGDVSKVCQRCHFEKYAEFKAGIHGKDAKKCSAKGCHDPHSPSWMYVAALEPFQGTGMEVDAVGADRQPFKPFPGPPPAAPVTTPTWLWVVTALAAVYSLAVVGFLVSGKAKR